MTREDRLGLAALSLIAAAGVLVALLSHYFGMWVGAGVLIVVLVVAAACLLFVDVEW